MELFWKECFPSIFFRNTTNEKPNFLSEHGGKEILIRFKEVFPSLRLNMSSSMEWWMMLGSILGMEQWAVRVR